MTLDTFALRGMLAAEAVAPLRRDPHATPFDFVLKRSPRSPSPAGGRRFAVAAFASRCPLVRAR